MKLSTAVKPISYLKTHASRLIRELSGHQGTVIVTHNGQAKAVLQDIHTYERTQETLALLKILTRSQQNVRRGKVKSIDAAFASLFSIPCRPAPTEIDNTITHMHQKFFVLFR